MPACLSSHFSLPTQLVLAPVPAAQDLRSPTVYSARRAGPCITSSVSVSEALALGLGRKEPGLGPHQHTHLWARPPRSSSSWPSQPGS